LDGAGNQLPGVDVTILEGYKKPVPWSQIVGSARTGLARHLTRQRSNWSQRLGLRWHFPDQPENSLNPLVFDNNDRNGKSPNYNRMLQVFVEIQDNDELRVIYKVPFFIFLDIKMLSICTDRK
jgi:hypothetical protein